MTTFISRDADGAPNACSGCPAPCCRLQLHPIPTPTTAGDLDLARYRLLSPASEIAINRDFEWTIVRWLTCTLFDEGRCSCTAHGTPRQPRVCDEFDATSCWFKRNFVGDEPEDLLRFDGERLEQLLAQTEVDAAGRIQAWPSADALRRLAGSRPPSSPFLEARVPDAA